MSKDKSEINTRAGWFVQSVRVDCNEPIGLQCKTKCLADFVLDSDIWVNSKKRLLVENYVVLRLPGILVAIEQIEGSLCSATYRSSDIWIYSAEFPEPIYQFMVISESIPAYFICISHCQEFKSGLLSHHVCFCHYLSL